MKILNDKEISYLAGICQQYLTSYHKEQLRYFEKKYGISLRGNKKDNYQQFWDYCINEIKEIDKKHPYDTRRSYSLTYIIENTGKVDGWSTVREILIKHIEYKHKDFMNWYRNYHPDTLIDYVKNGLTSFGIEKEYRKIQISDLIEVDDYYGYFYQKYGAPKMDTKVLKNIDKVVEHFEKLLKDIPRKDKSIPAVIQYLQDGDKIKLYNDLT